MPGIAGLISSLPDEPSRERLGLMVRTLLHEDFYSHGTLHAPDMHVHAGWTSLEGSFSDCMPIVNESGDVVLLLAGEVFPDRPAVSDLRRKGHPFEEGDAGYLVHLYEEAGERFFGGLNGCFSGFLMDRRSGKSYLFNDRYGMHRIFFHEGKDGFFFSSEAKALLAVLPETREFDPKGLCEFVSCGCTLGENSLFKGIGVLPGGSLLEFAGGKLLRRTLYFDRKAWEEQDPLPEAEFTERFIGLFPETARKYLSSRRRVGFSLTGGLDSRMVMAGIDPAPGSLPCYTFGSMYRDTFDVKVARRVAGQCSLPHRVLVSGEEFLDGLRDYLERAVFLSDGYLGLSGAAELYVNALARGIAPVRLTGNWGSELLRGVRAFQFVPPRVRILSRDLDECIEEGGKTFQRMNGMSGASFVSFFQAPMMSHGRISIERSQVDLRTPFLDNGLMALIHRKPERLDGFALAEALIARCRPDLLAIPTDRGYLGDGGLLARKVRRIHREVLFKAEYRIGPGAPGWLTRRGTGVGSLALERLLLGRHKFYHLRSWLRDRFESAMVEILEDGEAACASPFVDWNASKQIMKDHLLKKRNYSEETETLLNLSIIGKLFFSQKRDPEFH
jgi:asparagine synthase (glutamine-hydrolysing)